MRSCCVPQWLGNMSLQWGFKGGVSSAAGVLREGWAANGVWWVPGEPLGLKGRGVATTWQDLWQGSLGWSSG